MMSELVKTVNFGSTKTGLVSSVGYRLIDETGTPVQDRVQSGVYETFPGTGIYSATITFPEGFKGTILWDIDGVRPIYAAEEFNNAVNGAGVSQQVTEVTSQVNTVSDQVTDLADEIRFIRGMTAGRWKLDKNTATMTYYDESGKNVLVTYELLDENGNPSLESVYDRKIKEAITMIMSIADQQNIIADLRTSGNL